MQNRRASWLGGKWDKKTCRYLICIGRPSQRLQFIDISLIILESSVSNQAGYQCPTTGFPHFYAILISTARTVLETMISKNEVSMPYHGLSSFLHDGC